MTCSAFYSHMPLGGPRALVNTVNCPSCRRLNLPHSNLSQPNLDLGLACAFTLQLPPPSSRTPVNSPTKIMSDLTPADYPPYPRPESRSGGGTLALVFAIFTPLVALFLLGLAIVLWNKRSTKRAARRSANRSSIPMTGALRIPAEEEVLRTSEEQRPLQSLRLLTWA